MKATIPQSALKAVSRFAGVKDIRYYLNGVYVQASPAETRATASDGHTIASYRALPVADDEGLGANEGFGSFIVPNDAVKVALGWKLSTGADILIELSADGEEGKLSAAGQGVTFKRIDGKFPDYTRVISAKEASGIAGHFNPEYVSRCQAAIHDLHGKRSALYVRIGHNGEDAAIMDCGDANFVAVVMPVRVSGGPITAPAWILQPVAVAPEALKIAA